MRKNKNINKEIGQFASEMLAMFVDITGFRRASKRGRWANGQ